MTATGARPMKALYLHGFRSSPASFKARLLEQAMARRGLPQDWHCPQLPASPAQAMALCRQWVEATFAAAGAGADVDTDAMRQAVRDGLVVIGSSLGGYYATCLAEQWQCRAVVLNPVVHAARDLATQVGKHTEYHGGGPFEFLPEHVDELAAMAVPPPRDPSRYYLLAATGDEVLDWREMRQWYAGSHGHLIQGGDHGISNFADWLPDVMAFVLGQAPYDYDIDRA